MTKEQADELINKLADIADSLKDITDLLDIFGHDIGQHLPSDKMPGLEILGNIASAVNE